MITVLVIGSSSGSSVIALAPGRSQSGVVFCDTGLMRIFPASVSRTRQFGGRAFSSISATRADRARSWRARFLMLAPVHPVVMSPAAKSPVVVERTVFRTSSTALVGSSVSRDPRWIADHTPEPAAKSLARVGIASPAFGKLLNWARGYLVVFPASE